LGHWEITDCDTGLAHSEHCVPRFHGYHSRCEDFPPDSCHSPSWLHASHESQLDHVSHCSCIRAEIPARVHVGAILQFRGIHYWDIYQHAYKEEETGGFEKEGRRPLRFSKFFERSTILMPNSITARVDPLSADRDHRKDTKRHVLFSSKDAPEELS